MDRVLSFFKTVFKELNQFCGFFSLNREGHLQTPLILLAIAGISCLMDPAEILASQTNEIGIVTVNNLNMRPEPGTTLAPLRTLKKGTKVKILDRSNGWIKIEYEGLVGYISDKKRYVRIIKQYNINEDGKGALNGEIEDLKKEAESISKKIEQHESEVLAFSEKEAAIINDLNEIDINLNKATKRVAAIKLELASLKKRIRKAEAASKELIKRIKTGEIYASKRLAALYKLSWLGSMSYLASAESMVELFQRRAALNQILAYDENILKDLGNNKDRLQKLLHRLNAQKKEKLDLEANFNKQIRILSREEKKRSKLLVKIQKEKSLEMALIESLKEAANSLDHTIRSLGMAPSQPKQVNKKLLKNFVAHKGLLNMPVQGKIVTNFGSYKIKKFNITSFRNGIDIRADRGEPVRAVCTGKILYSDWFKGYGNMVIIDHGDNYYSVYAHTEEIFRTKGDTVDTGEVIATVGDTGSIIGPGLYFEVRHHGRPMNPLRWIKKG